MLHAVQQVGDLPYASELHHGYFVLPSSLVNTCDSSPRAKLPHNTESVGLQSITVYQILTLHPTEVKSGGDILSLRHLRLRCLCFCFVLSLLLESKGFTEEI